MIKTHFHKKSLIWYICNPMKFEISRKCRWVKAENVSFVSGVLLCCRSHCERRLLEEYGGLVLSAPAWDETGCEFDSWHCRYICKNVTDTILWQGHHGRDIPCSFTWVPSGFSTLGAYGLTRQLCWKKNVIAQAWTLWAEGSVTLNGTVVCLGHGVPEMVTPAPAMRTTS